MTVKFPLVPTVDDLASDRLDVRPADPFNPPGLTNFLGTLQVDRDLMAVRSIAFPPLWGSDVVSGQLFVDGRFVQGLGEPLSFTWYPDRIVRETAVDELRLRSTTALAVGQPGVVVVLEIETTRAARTVDLRLRTTSAVRREVMALREACPVGEATSCQPDVGRGAWVATGTQTGAVMVQGIVGVPVSLEDGDLLLTVPVTPGAPTRLTFIVACGDDATGALDCYDRLAADPQAILAEARENWNAELAAAVTPGNDRYSGHLPQLATSDHALWRLYWTGILGVITFKRDNPASVLGRVYDTLMPRYWPTITFLWDYSLSSVVHALLDPEPMRSQLEHWMRSDVHTCMGTSWLTGDGVGMWYGVNDYAMTRLVLDHVRWTGAWSWLQTEIDTGDGPTTPLDQVVRHAGAWKQFQKASGLADYGGIGNLLECVSTYVHEVASLNAANVHNLRAAGDLLAAVGRGDEAGPLRAEADDLVKRLLDLYVDGEGHFVARFPDGSRRSVRHVYDLLTVLHAIPDDLGDRHDELVHAWETDLRTDRWLRALSVRDLDATFSVRADHQYNGAYTAWPSEVVRGLYRIGEGARAAAWLRGLAASANQGPFGQAHFVEQVVDPIAGGARKAPPELPYISDWACSSGGSWVAAIIEGVFGVQAGLDRITARPCLDGFDPHAALVGLTHAGETYDVTASGLVATATP